MISKTQVVITKTLDPWWNLAVEEYLLDRVDQERCILYLWQNQNTVVIGKHQNPWRECKSELLEKEGGKLARRLSGGGTVFHDTGNLNFTFLVNQQNYDLSKQVGVILAAVKRLGIPAEMSGRNDLTVEGRKFSGNAFCFRKPNAYHHGTILLSADFSKLSRYLQVSEDKIKSKGIESVQSRVVNLSEYNPSLTVEIMKDSLINEFTDIYGGDTSVVTGADWMDQEILNKLYDRYASWKWRYGETPQFDMDVSARFQWGGIELGMKLEKGIIENISVYSDAMDEELISLLPHAFIGRALNSAELSKSILDVSKEPERLPLLQDISHWLEEKNF